MRFASSLVIAFLGSLALPALAWENTKAHPTINQRAFDYFLKNTATGAKYRNGPMDRELVVAGPSVIEPGSFNITTGLEARTVALWLGHGGYSADEPEVVMSLRHFFDPLAKDQYYLTDIIGDNAITNPAIDARTWALVGPSSGAYPENEFSWQNAMDDYRRAMEQTANREENLARAFRGLGETMHLLADMTQPAHVRNDGHPRSEPIEDAVGKELIEGVDVNVAPGVTLTASVPELLFLNVASYTNATFYSNDTVADVASGIRPFNGKPTYDKPSLAELTYVDGVVYRGTDRVLEQTLAGYIFGTNAARPFHIPAAFAPDYARHLIPLAVQANARLIDLFLPDLSLTLTVQQGTSATTLGGQLAHKLDSVWTRAIAYSGPGILYKRGGQPIAEVTFVGGAMTNLSLSLAKGDVVYLEVKAGGRVFRSPEVTVAGPAADSVLARWQSKTGAIFAFTAPLVYDNGDVQSTDPPGMTFMFMSMLGNGITWNGASFGASKKTTTGPMSMPGDREWTLVETTTLTGTVSQDGRTLETVRAENIKASTSVYTDGHSEESRDTAVLEAKALPLTSESSGQFSVSSDVRTHLVRVEQTDATLKRSSIDNAQWDKATVSFSFQ
jgi:hypothetical protein